MSTVVRSKRTSKCRDVLFETKFMAPTWPKQAVAAAAAWLPRSRRTCRAAWVAERTSRASSDGGRRPRAPLRQPMQLRAPNIICEDFSRQPARSSRWPRGGGEPALMAAVFERGLARPAPRLRCVLRDTGCLGSSGRPDVLAPLLCMECVPGVRACRCGQVRRLRGVARDGCGVRRPLGRSFDPCPGDRLLYSRTVYVPCHYLCYLEPGHGRLILMS